MKSIKDEVSLKNKLEEITMMELRKAPGEVIGSVELGKVFIIKKNKKPVAVLSRLPDLNNFSVRLSIRVGSNGKISYTL